ncbi:MAG TPA: glycosyltransferase family 4 protein [Candidatus Paceibacterota bacterium]
MLGNSRKKRILYIVTKSVWGGAQKYTYDLASSLPRDEFEVHLAAGGEGALREKNISAGIPYREIKNFSRDFLFIKDVLAFFEVLKIIKGVKPDIIHVSSSKAGGIAGLAWFVYKKIEKTRALFERNSPLSSRDGEKVLSFSPRSVFTVHGWAFNEDRAPWQIWLIKTLSKATCLFYDKIICVSEYDREVAIKNKIAPADKMVVIHNGVNPDSYHFLPREESRERLLNHSLPPGSLLIGTIGEFTKNKGQKYLIEAIKKLKAKSPAYAKASSGKYKLEAILIGFGEDEARLKNQISSLKLEDIVFLLTNIPDAAKYLKAFDIFVLPSVKEGLPYVLLEAGLAELPIIATNVGGIPEIIGSKETGVLVPYKDANSLEKEIRKLLEDTDVREMFAKNINKRILENFGFEKTFQKTLSTYH